MAASVHWLPISGHDHRTHRPDFAAQSSWATARGYQFLASARTRCPLKPHLRSAVTQSFEFTYELAIHSTRRVLIERAESADLMRDLSFNDLLRRALDAGLPRLLAALLLM